MAAKHATYNWGTQVLACMRKRIEDWLELLRDVNVVARCTAARALGQMGPQAREAMPALIQALQDREPLVRDAVADAIGCIDPQAPDAVLGLMQALADTNSFVQTTAAKALKKIEVSQASNLRLD
jgi:HEAT repeat protein